MLFMIYSSLTRYSCNFNKWLPLPPQALRQESCLSGSPTASSPPRPPPHPRLRRRTPPGNIDIGENMLILRFSLDIVSST